jgi:hypothetical protein
LLFAGLGREIGGPLPVLGKLTGKNNVVAIGTENFLQLGLVELISGSDERGGGLLRTVKTSGTGSRARGTNLSWFRGRLLPGDKD